VNGLAGVWKVAGGGSHSLALKDNGTVWAWGTNWKGQLGDGTIEDRPTPVLVPGLFDVAAIAAGRLHSLALKRDGTVWAWGWDFGQLGDGMSADRYQPTPAPVSGLAQVVAIAAADFSNLALKSDGTVWAWGRNDRGVLGDGTTSDRPAPVQVGGLSDVVGAATDGLQSIAVDREGKVWAWGCVGPVTTIKDRFQLTPVEVSGLGGAAAVAVGSGYGLAVKRDGTAWEWAGLKSAPMLVSGLSGVMALAGTLRGDYYYSNETCDGCDQLLALKSDGTVWTWGEGLIGRLSEATDVNPFAPVQIGGLAGVTAIAAGETHGLAVKSDGTVWAWGNDRFGQLGDRAANRMTPVRVIPPGSPDLAIAMHHEGGFAVGEQGVYTLTLTNIGATATSGVITVTDTLPPGLTYISATGSGWNCSASDETVTCTNGGPLNGGASSTITLTVNVGFAATPGATNFAMVANASDRNISNDAVGDPTDVSPGR
jgi:uncharacterized repeat protein (TIGR01451 family)